MQTDEVEALQQLAAYSILSIVPSGDSDDAYILNYARDNNGYVISNDLFHDHLRSLEVQSVRSSMNVWLAEHRCGYAFTSRQQFLFNPVSSLRAAIQVYHERYQQEQQMLVQQQREQLRQEEQQEQRKREQDRHGQLVRMQQTREVSMHDRSAAPITAATDHTRTPAAAMAAPLPAHVPVSLTIQPPLPPPVTVTAMQAPVVALVSTATHDINTPMSCTSDVTVGDAAPHSAYYNIITSVSEAIKQVMLVFVCTVCITILSWPSAAYVMVFMLYVHAVFTV